MSTITCPHCGGVFPLAAVAQFHEFTCGGCGRVIPVPAARPVAPAAPAPRAPAPVARAAPAPAAPAPAAPTPSARPAPSPAPAPAPARTPAPAPRAQAAPAPRPAAPPVAERQPPTARAARTSRAAASSRSSGDDDAGDDDVRPRFPVAAVAAGGLVLAGIVAFALARRGDDDGTVADVPAVGATSGGDAAAAPAADPEKDVAAWKALPEADRRLRAQMKLQALPPKDESAALRLVEFLKERGETDVLRDVATSAVAQFPDAAWAREAAGHQELHAKIETALRECPNADFQNTDTFLRLKILRKRQAPAKGPWWGDAETVARVDEILDLLRKEEVALRTPHGQAVAHWVNYHRSIDGMRDFPAIHGTVGPYLVFVSLPVERSKEELETRRFRDVTVDDVKPEDLEHGKKILAETLALYGAFYDGWHATLGPLLGFTKYGPETVDKELMLLVNVFTSVEDYDAYNDLTGGPDFARAYYSPQEPRFIVTYDGQRRAGEKAPSQDPDEDAAQIQCHEGTHQLVHLYTWDLTRRKTNEKIEWLGARPRRMWSQEGFAECFSSYTRKDGAYSWMQPLDSRLADIWIITDVLKARGWEDWRLREILDPVGNQQMQIIAQSRQRRPEDAGIVVSAMANLFYARGWSLNYFLWNAQEGGAPKYRDRFIGYMRSEFEMKLHKDPSGRMIGRLVTADEFRKAFGITDDAAFEKEWRSFEEQLIRERKKPSWDERRRRILEAWKVGGVK